MEFRRVLFRSTGNRARRTGDCASRRLRRRGGATARDRALCRGKGPLMRVGVYPGTFDPITLGHMDIIRRGAKLVDRLVIRSEEHTSELQSLMRISYAVFCLQKQKTDK